MKHVARSFFIAVLFVAPGHIVTGQLFIMGGVFTFVAQLLLPGV